MVRLALRTPPANPIIPKLTITMGPIIESILPTGSNTLLPPLHILLPNPTSITPTSQPMITLITHTHPSLNGILRLMRTNTPTNKVIMIISSPFWTFITDTIYSMHSTHTNALILMIDLVWMRTYLHTLFTNQSFSISAGVITLTDVRTLGTCSASFFPNIPIISLQAGDLDTFTLLHMIPFWALLNTLPHILILVPRASSTCSKHRQNQILNSNMINFAILIFRPNLNSKGSTKLGMNAQGSQNRNIKATSSS